MIVQLLSVSLQNVFGLRLVLFFYQCLHAVSVSNLASSNRVSVCGSGSEKQWITCSVTSSDYYKPCWACFSIKLRVNNGSELVDRLI